MWWPPFVVYCIAMIVWLYHGWFMLAGMLWNVATQDAWEQLFNEDNPAHVPHHERPVIQTIAFNVFAMMLTVISLYVLYHVR